MLLPIIFGIGKTISDGDTAHKLGTHSQVETGAGIAVVAVLDLFLLYWGVRAWHKAQKLLATHQFRTLTETDLADPRNAQLCAEVARLHAQGMSHRAIGRKLDLHWSQVGQILGEIGLLRRGRNGEYRRLRKKSVVMKSSKGDQ